METLDALFVRFRRTGDAGALGEIYDRSAPRLLRAAIHWTRTPAQAEDLLQATFLAAIERRDSYDEARPLEPWLMGILANQARLQRWRDRKSPDPDRLAPRPVEDPAAQAEHAEFTEAVDDAIATLPEIYQSVLVLSLRHGLQPAEIAHALRRPPGTVRAQLTRGLEQLRRALPASVAGAIALAAPATRGLAAVRAEVLLAGSSAAATAATAATTTVLGVVAMKKILLAVTATAAGALIWWSASQTPEAVAPGTPETLESIRLSGDEPVASEPVIANPERRSVREPATAPRDAGDGSTAPLADGEVRGSVRWSHNGEPVAGVTVWFRPETGWDTARHTVVTDERGRFSFVREEPTSYRIGTDRHHATRLVHGGRPVEVVLRLPRGCAVTGTVRDEIGRPVPGAAIWLSERWLLEAGQVIARTDADGTYRIEGIGEERYVGARAERHRPSPVQFLNAESRETISMDFVVARGAARVEGRAFGSDGGPLEGAMVRLAPLGRPDYVASARGAITRAWAPTLVMTDADGNFAADGLPPGRLSVRVRAAGHGTFDGEIEVPSGATGSITANVPAGAVITGRVAQQDGSPASVLVRTGVTHDDFTRVMTHTDANGDYRLEGVAPGTVELTVFDGNDAVLDETLELNPGEVREWNPVIVERPGIRGRVVDATLRPLEGWIISLHADERYVEGGTTDRDGYFAIEGLEDIPHRVMVAAPARANNPEYPPRLAGEILEDVTPGGAPLEVRIAANAMPTCSSRGRVLGPGDRVIPQARISFGHMNGKGVVNLKVDRDTGEFEIEGLVPGAYWVTAKTEGHPWITVGRVEFAPGQDRDLGTLRFVDGQSVSGQILAADPSLVEEAEVEVWLDSRRTGVVEKRGSGFESSLLPPGSYELVVRGGRVAPKKVPFEIRGGADTTLDVTVEPGVRRTVRATVPPNTGPLDMVWMTVMVDGQTLLGRRMDAQPDGTYLAEIVLAPGSYSLGFGTGESGLGGLVRCEIRATEPNAPEIVARLAR